jgi:hypothetical protein
MKPGASYCNAANENLGYTSGSLRSIRAGIIMFHEGLYFMGLHCYNNNNDDDGGGNNNNNNNNKTIVPHKNTYQRCNKTNAQMQDQEWNEMIISRWVTRIWYTAVFPNRRAAKGKYFRGEIFWGE